MSAVPSGRFEVLRKHVTAAMLLYLHNKRADSNHAYIPRILFLAWNINFY